MDKYWGNNLGVVNACLPLALLSVFVAVCHAAICPEKQYLNSKLQICMNCTDCKDGSVVLRPCELHRDTHCGPLSAISDLLDSSNSNHRHRHEKFRSDKQKTKGVVEWRYGEDVDEDGSSRLEVPEAMEVSSSEAPFSRAEKLVWDWQAIALTSAVFACIMFFLVVTMYSLYQAKQWRRLKENFEA
ncbi:uncharacterized protein LOC132697654, partial [Cylas formicarius]|uniref:uncharacterized protein LOC132697654 n=1 Tax=Cylas formicarius TaxID=197179 RepID=UPI0029583399